MICKKELLIVIVVYKKHLKECITYKSLVSAHEKMGKQLEKLNLFVYDNSPEEFSNSMVYGKFESLGESVEYRSDPTNPGVSKAYNMGAKYAQEKGFKYLLLLDQDSCLPNSFFEKLYGELRKKSPSKLICPIIKYNNKVISPAKFFWHRSKVLKELHPGIYNLKEFRPINSGLTIDLELFLKSGGYDESFSLDFSDHYFLHKLSSSHSELHVLDIELSHSLSSNDHVSLEKFYERFDVMLKATFNYSKKTKQKISYLWLFIYILKRSVKYRTFGIIKYAIQNYK